MHITPHTLTEPHTLMPLSSPWLTPQQGPQGERQDASVISTGPTRCLGWGGRPGAGGLTPIGRVWGTKGEHVPGGKWGGSKFGGVFSVNVRSGGDAEGRSGGRQAAGAAEELIGPSGLWARLN